MIGITMDDAEAIGGAGALGWAVQQLAVPALKFAGWAVITGQVDYAGLAQSSGTYYCMVGA